MNQLLWDMVSREAKLGLMAMQLAVQLAQAAQPGEGLQYETIG